MKKLMHTTAGRALVAVLALIALVSLAIIGRTFAADKAYTTIIQDTDSPQKVQDKAFLGLAGNSNLFNYTEAPVAVGTGATIKTTSAIVVGVAIGSGSAGMLTLTNAQGGTGCTIAKISTASSGVFIPLNVKTGTNGFSAVNTGSAGTTIIYR